MLEVITKLKSNSYNLNDSENKKILIFSKAEDQNDVDYNLDITLKNDSDLVIYNVVTASKDVKINEEITINGKGSKVDIVNVLIANNAKVESNIMIHHNEASSESNLANYAIAKGSAKMILNNNATIKQGCHKSVVHQKAKGLTLSKDAEIIAQPNLFIDEFDVIANHAASIGSINKEDLFYLTSRGLSTEEASKLIVLGFIKPIIDNIEDENLQNEIYKSFVSML